ncbi:MAG: ATP-binding cassette domain-containing protein, partial [Planctomycetota bacterium]
MAEQIIRIEALRFRYRDSDFALHVPALAVAPGETVGFIGPSGSGKTTLLNLLAGIVLPESGTVDVDGASMTGLSDPARRAFRIRRIGMIFQEFELLEHLSVLDNVLLPYRISPALRLDGPVRDRAVALARRVGIEDKLTRTAGRLSQGEKQRVAICRAL